VVGLLVIFDKVLVAYALYW